MKNILGVVSAVLSFEYVTAVSNSQSFELSALRNSNGLTMTGATASARTGSSVSSAGDINGDGYDDFLIGAVNGNSNAGATYVVFGSDTIDTDFQNSSLKLGNLDGSNGFVINGIDSNDQSSISISSAGDFNKDGFGDIVIGAWLGNSLTGEAYIVYGSASIGSSGSLELSSLDGNNGFVLYGESLSEQTGFSVSGGYDFNGDTYDDVLIGAKTKNSLKGAVYMVLGGDSVDSSTGSINLADLDGSNGFIINGIVAGDQCGTSVRFAGDVNGDGNPDIVIGASSAEPNSVTDAGEVYVLFGGSSVNGGLDAFELSTLDGTNGVTLYGSVTSGLVGTSVAAAGDVNNDGFDDILIGSTSGAGTTYLVYGASSLSSSISLIALDGSDGVIINGATSGDFSSWTLSAAGDFNGDSYDDFLIGAYLGDPNGITNAGETFMVFGGASLTSPISLGALDGTDGFVINGIATSDRSGYAVSVAGDVNSDGFMDYLIGATLADPYGLTSAGEAYLLLGNGGFTFEPTSFPTLRPSFYPTPLPTRPSPAPTDVPTMVPFPSPTQQPTMVPFPSPTQEPTMMPFPVPTSVPIPAPSSVPIPAPTPPPTMSPSIVPTPLPTLRPSYQPTSVPTHAPTSMPSPRPSPQPSLWPTTEDTVSVSVSFTITATTTPTTADEDAVMNLIANYSGITVFGVKNFAIDDGVRRRTSEMHLERGGLRALVNYLWTVTCDVEADLSDVAATSINSFSSTVRSQLNSGSFYLSVRSNIPSASSVDSVMTTPNTRHPTPQPTLIPSSAPTQMPIQKKSSDDANAAMVYLWVLMVIPLAVIVFLCYHFRAKIKAMINGEAAPEGKKQAGKKGKGKPQGQKKPGQKPGQKKGGSKPGENLEEKPKLKLKRQLSTKQAKLQKYLEDAEEEEEDPDAPDTTVHKPASLEMLDDALNHEEEVEEDGVAMVEVSKKNTRAAAEDEDDENVMSADDLVPTEQEDEEDEEPKPPAPPKNQKTQEQLERERAIQKEQEDLEAAIKASMNENGMGL